MVLPDSASVGLIPQTKGKKSDVNLDTKGVIIKSNKFLSSQNLQLLKKKYR